jgi:hypothetical protein
MRMSPRCGELDTDVEYAAEFARRERDLLRFVR